MKNRVITYIFLFILLFCLTGCKKTETTTDASYFIDCAYKISKGEITSAVIIDLRPLQNDIYEDDYDHGHIHGALSFNYAMQTEEKFTNWIKGLKNTNTTVYLIDSGNGEYETISAYLEKAGYKKIIAYTLGYQELKKCGDFTTKIEESTGIEDCGC